MRPDLVRQMDGEVVRLVDAALADVYFLPPFDNIDTDRGQRFDSAMWHVRHMAEQADNTPDDVPFDGRWCRATLACHLQTMIARSNDRVAQVVGHPGYGIPSRHRHLSAALADIVEQAPPGQLAAAMEYARWRVVALASGVDRALEERRKRRCENHKADDCPKIAWDRVSLIDGKPVGHRFTDGTIVTVHDGHRWEVLTPDGYHCVRCDLVTIPESTAPAMLDGRCCGTPLSDD